MGIRASGRYPYGPKATWRSGYAAACKAVYTGSIPVVASPRIVLIASLTPRGRGLWILAIGSFLTTEASAVDGGGRSAAERGPPVHAIVALTSVSPSGTRSTRSIRVTLTRR